MSHDPACIHGKRDVDTTNHTPAMSSIRLHHSLPLGNHEHDGHGAQSEVPQERRISDPDILSAAATQHEPLFTAAAAPVVSRWGPGIGAKVRKNRHRRSQSAPEFLKFVGQLDALAETPVEEEEEPPRGINKDPDWLEVARIKRKQQLERFPVVSSKSPLINEGVEDEDADEAEDRHLEANTIKSDEATGGEDDCGEDAIIVNKRDGLTVPLTFSFGIHSLPATPESNRKQTFKAGCLRKTKSEHKLVNRHVRFALPERPSDQPSSH